MFENLKTGQNTAIITFTLMTNMSNPTDLQIWVQESATVEITKLNDEEVEGNFSATLVGLSSEKKITNCKFRAKFLN
jgi:pectate lyase